MNVEQEKRVRELEAKLRADHPRSETRLGTAKIDVEALPTGIPTLDRAIGIGGMPRGRIVEVFGPEGSGKSAVALAAIANTQRNGGVAGFVDAEFALTPKFATMLGVDFSSLLYAQPGVGEDAMDIIEDMAVSGVVDIIALDSVAALVPEQELEGEYGDANVGSQAKLMSSSLRRLAGVVARTNAVVIFINQLRSKVEMNSFVAKFGKKEQTAGGRALRFYASLRVEVQTTTKYKQGDKQVGHKVKIRIEKNKVAPPFETAEWDLFYRNCVVDGVSHKPGIDWVGAALEAAIDEKIIPQKSSFYYLVDDDGVEICKANGKQAFRQMLESDEMLMDIFLSKL